ncbi:MAG: molybdopterin-dependent oxidoreductase [Xanthobacteraceae bacterium]|nr:molybdopterin-dependent oxidoreductase [Xanthobacteraceae bacterium]
MIHPDLGDNLTFERRHEAGAPDTAFAEADEVVEATFRFGRHTGVTNEPRAVVATESRRAAVDRSSRHPGAAHDTEPSSSSHLASKSTRCGVITKNRRRNRWASRYTPMRTRWLRWRCRKLLKRPVKFVADRIESFVSDIHARDHRVQARVAVSGTAPSRPSGSTTSRASGPIRSIRHQRHRGEPGRQPHGQPLRCARTTGRWRASCSRTRT